MIVSAVGRYTEGSLTGAVGGHVLVTTLTALEPGQDLDLVPVLLPLVMAGQQILKINFIGVGRHFQVTVCLHSMEESATLNRY